jgi:hypothetical protein
MKKKHIYVLLIVIAIYHNLIFFNIFNNLKINQSYFLYYNILDDKIIYFIYIFNYYFNYMYL